LLFCTHNGKQLSQSNILRRHLHPQRAYTVVGALRLINRNYTQNPDDL
jgi:hypothetical protein